jgi:hypothetical protein
MGYIGNAPYSGLVTGDNVLDGSIKAEDLAPGAAVPSQTGQSGKYLTTDGTNASWGAIVTGVRVSGITYSGDDLATSPNGGQTVTLNGSGFVSTPTVFVDGTIAPSVSFVSSSQITFVTPAKSAGTYHVYVVNPDGSTAIFVNGISYSGVPTWTTAAGSLGTFSETFSIQLTATGDAPITYTLTTGSSLPAGVTLSSSGLISGTVGTEQTFSFSVDAIDAQNQETPRSFSVSISISDAYFEYTTLLLAGSGATDSAFTDASTSNHPITLNGDVANSTFSPYNTSWSNFFDGTGDWITTPNVSAFDLSSSSTDFTIEAWVYNTGGGAYRGIIGARQDGQTQGWCLYIHPNNTLYLGSVIVGNAYADRQMNTTVIPPNTWVHVALVKTSSGYTGYVNGVGGTLLALTGGLQYQSAQPVIVGALGSQGEYPFLGFISNARVVKGTAVYTANFTPPTAPLTAIANTSLLTCQSNRLRDASTNNFAITRNGDVAVRAFSPFTDTDTTTGSVYFDGTGDYLTVPDNAALEVGSSNFTFECWFYPTALATDNILVDFGSQGSQASIIPFYVFSNGNVGYYVSSGGSTWNIASNANGYGGTVKIGQWNHLAFVRNGNTFTPYLNGVAGTTTTSSSSVNDPAVSKYIGSATTGTAGITGYLADFRLVKGTAVYTANFTPPTAPLTAITNTSLLTCQKRGPARNSSFLDTGPHKHLITRNGNTTQGTFSPFSPTGWGMNQTVSSDYLGFTTSVGTAFQFPGDFTIECWVFPTAYSGTGDTSAWVVSDNTNYLALNYDGSGNYNIYLNSGSPTSFASGIVTNQWNHIAMVRNGSTVTLYTNGTSRGAITNSSTLGYANPPVARNGGGVSGTTRYMSNLRVVKGTAVYTANFTPPTTPLTAITNTQLLTLQSNRWIDNSPNNFTATVTGSPLAQAFSPFNPTAAWSAATNGGSGFFDGTGDYIQAANSPAFAFNTGTFTVEFWYYPTKSPDQWDTLFGSSGNAGIFFACRSGFLDWTNNNDNAALIRSNWPTLFQWNHIALVQNASSRSVFINGVRTGTAGTYSWEQGSVTLGNESSGYFSDWRVVLGQAIYDPGSTTITVPTAPLTATTNTSLLCNFTNAGIYDATSKNDLETVGNAQITTAQSKWGGSSMYFDGTSDALYIPANPDFAFGTGDFTVECWIYTSETTADTFYRRIYMTDGPTGNVSGNFQIALVPTTGYVNLWDGTLDLIGTSNVCNGAWHHIAATRSGTILRLFVDGVQQASTTYSVSVSPNSGKPRPYIGTFNGSSGDFNGYIQDMRVTKGYARYTANFTPPTAAFKLR